MTRELGQVRGAVRCGPPMSYGCRARSRRDPDSDVWPGRIRRPPKLRWAPANNFRAQSGILRYTWRSCGVLPVPPEGAVPRITDCEPFWSSQSLSDSLIRALVDLLRIRSVRRFVRDGGLERSCNSCLRRVRPRFLRPLSVERSGAKLDGPVRTRIVGALLSRLN